MKKSMVRCHKCGSYALPEYMFSAMHDVDGCVWVCDECWNEGREDRKRNLRRMELKGVY